MTPLTEIKAFFKIISSSVTIKDTLTAKCMKRVHMRTKLEKGFLKKNDTSTFVIFISKVERRGNQNK